MLSKIFLIKQGRCCGNKCLMCPYKKKHVKGSEVLKENIIDALEDWEKEELKNILNYISRK